MEESEDNMNSDDVGKLDSPSAVKKPKKRSLVERELETNLTARVTSPAAIEGLSTSRYGRARRLKTDTELIETQKVLLASIKSPGNESTPVKVQSPVYRMHASNSPHKAETPKNPAVTYIDNQIDNIYQENISLSRFSDETVTSPAKKYPKVYIRKDLIQNREEEEPVMLIKNLFSPTKSGSKLNTHLSDSSVHSTEKYNPKMNGHIDNSSVVKTLDFDSNKKKRKEDKEKKAGFSKNELFELEAKCPYQVGDLAWARVGTFPFWPCIVTRDPYSEMFVKKKLFGRVEHDIVHVTFFGDNGRRSWIVDNMLRKYLGQLEFDSTREKFTAEDKKKDPRLYAAFFVSEKKQALWTMSVEEAETLLREPKRLRIDIFNDMLWKTRASKKLPKSGKISSRTNSDVSLSESLYDSLFSEKEVKADETEHSKKSRNKSFDVSEVVTACLDNMAAKTGITKIQRQSHMDRWLQKAKSKTPEKTQAKPPVLKLEKQENVQIKSLAPIRLTRKSSSKSNIKPSVPSSSLSHTKPRRFRMRTKSHSKLIQIESKSDTNIESTNSKAINDNNSITKSDDNNPTNCDLNVTTNVGKENDSSQDISTTIVIIDEDSATQTKNEPKVQNPDEPVNDSAFDTVEVKQIKAVAESDEGVSRTTSAINSIDDDLNVSKYQADVESTTNKTNDTLSITKNPELVQSLEKETIDISSVDNTTVTANELKSVIINQPIKDAQWSKSVEAVKEMASDIPDSILHSDTHPMEVSKRSSNTSDEANNKTSVSSASQDSFMEVDENTNDVTVQDKSEKSFFCEPANERTNFGSQTNEDASPNSENVSNKSVEDNVVTDLKEAQNVVTIEVSVTEKNNDDTLNNLPQGGEQESIDKLNPKDDTLNFLDKSNSLIEGIAETNYLIDQNNSSTTEKYERHKTKNKKSSKISPRRLNLESKITSSDNIFRKEKEFIILKDDTDKNYAKNVHIEDSVFIDDVTLHNDKTMDSTTDVLNESATSESILQLCTDNPEFEKGEEILEMAFSDSMKPETMLESIQINTINNVSTNEKSENAQHLSIETECVADEMQNGSTRPYVESPTFTQLLDSEEFFRDVNETHDTYIKPEIDNSKQCPQTQEITPYDIEKSTKSVERNKVIDDFHEDDDDTSEDEPSPEYESLDDEITEDFRKHMMSIESNIKDKKDEDQIVKICNEIAEKAKLSPTKYNQDGGIAKTIDKIDTNSKNVSFTSPKEKNLITLNDFDAVHKEKVNTSSYDEQHIKVDKHCIALDGHNIEKQNKLKESHTDSTKDLNHSYEQTKINIQTDVVPEIREDTKIKIHDKYALNEISDKPKIFYKTRSSGSSVTKQRASPAIKIESSKIEQYRRSFEYEPKVVIIRLERDKIDYSIGSIKSKPIDEISKNYNKSRKSFSDSPDDKNLENEEEKSKNRKSRLSLRRDIPKSKETENKSMKNSEINLDESENITPKISKKEIVITASKVPKKIEISTCETDIPEHVKVNGYHHNIDRKFTDTPDIGDTDFDVDAVSLNSEDSEVSLPNSTDSLPKRSLRMRPERTLEYALKNPEFLKYLELRQDYLMDLHPELNEEEVVTYVHKTWQYEEDLKSDTKKIDDVRNNTKQETPRNKKSKKSQPKDSIENSFREKYEKSRNTIDFDSETGTIESSIKAVEQKVELNDEENVSKTEISEPQTEHSKPPNNIIDPNLENSNDKLLVEDKSKDVETVLDESEKKLTPIRNSRSRMSPKSLEKQKYAVEDNPTAEEKSIKEREIDTESVDSEDSEIPLRQLRSRALKANNVNGFKKETNPEKEADEVSASKEITLNSKIKNEADETASTVSDNEPLVKQKKKRTDKNSFDDPGFIQYLELRQDALMDENPQLTQAEILQYLHKIWLYEENSKSALEKNDELEQEANLVKGLNNNELAPSKKVKRRPKIEKQTEDVEVAPKGKPRRRLAQPFYNENYSDIEDELEVFEIFKTKKSALTAVSKSETEKDTSTSKSSKEESSKDTAQIEQVENNPENDDEGDVEYVDETEIYFTELTRPKPNVFKGLIREKVCEICENTGSLVKCKGCYGMFHSDCVKKQSEPIERVKESDLLLKCRKKKRKSIRKPKSLEDSESHSDDRSHDMSVDTSVEEIAPPEICAIDADYFETQLEIKMKEILETTDINYDSYSSDDGIDWEDSVAGKCEIVDVKLKKRDPPVDYSNFKCNNCQKYELPVCFVCKSAVSKTDVKTRQKCHVAHCHRYYHLECLDHWPQTQFNSGEPSRNNKKKNEFFEALTCPRHVCHTCVSDDPRGCKTRFSGDKLAKCVRCPATYHSFNKCLPAGSRILTASHIICPRHSEQKAGKVPCHVNTGWCFICAQGGSLICCEYCPTSFHAECLNIKPPEGNYMCEDCETGRLPLYGEMVWVKLGQYRWWPGIILHPSEIPENIMLVKHEVGEFVVRFFGQYDHYWVNRGRVFPYQEGDSGRISSQKSKINADFILAIEHAQRAYTILKNAQPDEEESLDIASSLLPPHYVKLKSNKASGSLCGKKIDDPSLSLTQCECNPDEPDPCGPYSQCLNRMLLTECGPTCRAAERCNNRAFERRLYPKLVPYRTPHRGWGLKTLQHIKAGQFVIEYVGELIDEEEFRRRMRRKHEIRDENFYFLTLDKERMIDAGPKGNVARFMNHCCEPNCETQKWTVLGDVRVGLFAIDDIPANSEVTFNYNLQCAGIEKKRCLCGASRCSGYIGAKPKQDESQTKKTKEGKLKRVYNKKKKADESPSTSKIKKKLGRPPKPKELTDLEKDVLIIKNATNLSSDESTKSEDKNPTTKKKSIPRDQVSLCNGQEEDTTKSLKRKRVSNTTDEDSILNVQEPCLKKQKCDKPSEVGD